MKIIVHAGFHKTGTTSLQETLRANRKLLAPQIRIILRPGMKALCEAARGWSASDDPIDLGLVKYEAALLGETLQDQSAETVILSSEDLCGHMPGRKGVKTYRAAPKLLQSVALGLSAALPDAELVFLLTTRAEDDWLASCHAQHLTASRMRLSPKDFGRKFAKAAKLEEVVDAVVDALPGYRVHRAALVATAATPLGAASAVFELLELTEVQRAGLRTVPRENIAPDPARRAELLALNQSGLNDTDLRAAKRALLKGTP